MSERACSKKCIRLFLAGIGSLMLTLIFSHGSYSGNVRGVTETSIKIGLAVGITGPAADVAVPVAEGVKNYTRYINDKGGIHGRKVKLIVEDDRFSVPSGVASFKKLVFKDGVFAMMGPLTTATIKALFGQVEKHKIPNVMYLPQPSMVNPIKRHIFVTGEFYDDDMGVIFDYIMNDLKPRDMKLGFVTLDTDSGKETLESVNKWAQFFNYKRPIQKEIIPLAAMDAVSQVMSIKRGRVTHILLHHLVGGGSLLLKDLRKFGIKTPVFGTLLTCSEDTVKLAGDASRNYIGANGMSSWYDDAPGMKKLRDITLKYNPGTEKLWRPKYFTAGWVMMMLHHEGMIKAGRDLTPESCVRGLESIKDFDTQGLCGLITYSPTDHKGISSCRLFRPDPASGKLVPITDWRTPPKIKE